MFGESDSESPRVPSPWDSFNSSPASPPKHNGTQGIPKLVPEAEEGNVEYKLQLLSPTPARFARLVTQLKWRLLEGGGQAYYELGVADCGTLVGLPRQQLEESLETLEMMAGEIGASVIVVKEIEVPPEISNLAESQLEKWDGKRSARRKDVLRMMKEADQDDESPTTSTTEVETELSGVELTDVEETTCYSPTTVSPPLGESNLNPLLSPFPFDPALAMFTMDLGEDVADYADNEGADDDADASTDSAVEFSIEVSSVYKPRPMKKRMTHVTPFEYVKKRHKNDCSSSNFTNTPYTARPATQGHSEPLPQINEVKSQLRRDKRDKRRGLNANGLLTHVPTQRSTELPADSAVHHAIPPSFNVSNLSPPESLSIVVADLLTADASETVTAMSKESRVIVEALVVRKMSLDEAFLDFEGFSLQ